MAWHASKIEFNPNRVKVGNTTVAGEIRRGNSIVWRVKKGNDVIRDRRYYELECLDIINIPVEGGTVSLTSDVDSKKQTLDGRTTMSINPSSITRPDNRHSLEDHTGIIQVTQAESNLVIDVQWKQLGDTIVSTRTINEYIELSGGTHDIVPASGATINHTFISNLTCTLYYHEEYTWASGGTTTSATMSRVLASGYTVSTVGNALVVPSRGTTPGVEQAISGTLTIHAIYSGLTSNNLEFNDFRQQANVESGPIWSTLTMALNAPADIPASGGTVSSTTIGSLYLSGNYTYTSGATRSITLDVRSSATVNFLNSVSADSLGTTIKSRTKMSTTLNAQASVTNAGQTKTTTASADVYQALNRVESTVQTTEYDASRKTEQNTNYEMTIVPTSRTGIAYQGTTFAMSSVVSRHEVVTTYPYERILTTITYSSNATSQSRTDWYLSPDPHTESRYESDSFTAEPQVASTAWFRFNYDIGNTITVDNNTLMADRASNMIFTNLGDTSKTAALYIQQLASPANYIKVYDQNGVEVADGGTINLSIRETYVMQIESNTSWSMTPDTTPSGFTINPTSGQSGTTNVTMVTRRSITSPEWTIVFTIVAGNATRTLNIHIDGVPPTI